MTPRTFLIRNALAWYRAGWADRQDTLFLVRRIRARYSGLNKTPAPTTRFYRNEAGVLEEYRVEKP